VIASVGRRIRSRMRGGDLLGRFSSNKFGVVLKTCTPDDLTAAADRFLGAVREDVVQTQNGPVAATITIRGGRGAAPRAQLSTKSSHTRRSRSIPPRPSGAARSSPTGRMSSAMRCARKTCQATDKIITALNERRIVLAFEPIVETGSRAPCIL
jgi:hypothetical protein